MYNIEDVTKIIQQIDQHIISEEFGVIDNTLANINVDTSPLIIVAYIRATFVAREKLVNWVALVKRFATYLDSIGENKKSYLLGLEKYYEEQ